MQISAQQWTQQLLQDHVGMPAQLADDFFDAALNYWKLEGCIPLVHFLLKQHASEQALPAGFSAALKRQASQSAALEMLNRAEIASVLEILAEHALDVLIIKGTALAYTHYPQPHLRTRCDTDLVFANKQDALSAAALIESLGYTRHISSDVHQELACSKRDAIGMRYTFDLHWKINNSPLFSESLGFDELSRKAIVIPQLGKHAKGLCDQHALLLACMHRLGHAEDGLQNHLLWLYDIKLIIERFDTPEWDAMLKLATEKQQHASLLDGLLQTRDILGINLPEAVIEKLKAGAAREDFNPQKAISWLKIKRMEFQAMPTWRARLKLVKQHLFPGADYMLDKYHAQSRWLLPMLYVHRIINGCVKQLRRHTRQS